MEEKKQRPDRLEPIQGEVSLKSKSEDSDYLYNNQILGESFESKKLINLINNKKRYIAKVNNPDQAKHLQKEILFLQNEILPIVLNESTLLYNEIVKYVTNKVHAAIEAECNVMVMVMELSPSTGDTIRIGTVNTHANPVEGIDLIINGNGRKTEEVQL